MTALAPHPLAEAAATAALRPTIRVIDFETGDAEPIEIGWHDVRAMGTDLLGRPSLWQPRLPGDQPTAYKLKPTRPIPPETSAVHHLVGDDFAFARMPAAGLRQAMEDDLDGASLLALAAHNAETEQAHLTVDYTGDLPWIDTWKCALRLWPEAPNHKLQTLRYWLSLPSLIRHTAAPAHRAGPDAYVTAHVLAAQLSIQPMERLVAWSGEPALLARIPFGELKGQPWAEADDGLLDWILQRDFRADVMFTARYHLAEREKTRRLAEDQTNAVRQDGTTTISTTEET